MSETSTTAGARAHARAQAATVAPFGPTLPASDAADPPAGVEPQRLLWEETVAPGGCAAHVLPRGATLRLTDLDGDACANLLVFSARRPVERLNVADTVKVQWQAYLGPGALLLSDMGRALLTITDDTSGRHDALCGSSNEVANARRYGSGNVEGGHPNARDRFAVAVAKFGLDRRDIPPSVAFFKHVQVDRSGALVFDESPSPPGAHVDLLAELSVLVVVANTPHVLDPRSDYTVSPLRLTAWSGRATSRDDDRWCATPERERALLNTEDALAEADQVPGGSPDRGTPDRGTGDA
jgi:uncharacterized protein